MHTPAAPLDLPDRLTACAGPSRAEARMAARYAPIRDIGCARHIRPTATAETGIWRGDAVYTISAAVPPGESKRDAGIVTADCAARGMPMA